MIARRGRLLHVADPPRTLLAKNEVEAGGAGILARPGIGNLTPVKMALILSTVTSVFTDNQRQPDFTWLAPYEEGRLLCKVSFPTAGWGWCKNANKKLALKSWFALGRRRTAWRSMPLLTKIISWLNSALTISHWPRTPADAEAR